MPDYLPNTDSSFRDWMNNFAALMSTDFLAYGLTAGDATTIQTAADAYDAAYVIANDPLQRTQTAIVNKDNARNAAKATARIYAQQLQTNEGVTEGQLSAAGLPIHDTDPTPIEAPITSPVLQIVGATPAQHTLRYNDQNTPTLRAKPAGAAGLELFVHIGDSPITNPNLATYYGYMTRQPIGVDLDPGDSGKTATYFGRWITARGLRGPWSLPVAMTIADGGEVAMAA